MFIKYSILLTTTIIASSFSLLAQAESSNFDQIFVFGNSVSDAGNVYGITGSTFPPSPLYYEGRFSNGQIWIDYLGEDLELNPSTFYSDSFTDAEDGINFAIGGATTGTNSLGDSPNISFPGVTTQVNDFINFLDGETISEDALVILWAGENDYVEAFQNSGTLINPAIPINNIANSLSQLADAGAKHILVPNLINLANTPLGRSFIPPEQLDRLTLLTNAHNNALNSAVDSLDKSLTETDFAILDVNSLLENIFENPLDFGFQENPLESCLSPNNFPDISPGVVPCENPEQYVYYDNQHFTTTTHKLVADTAITTIKTEFKSDSKPTTVPESKNIFALIGLGFSLLCELARRHKSTLKITTRS